MTNAIESFRRKTRNIKILFLAYSHFRYQVARLLLRSKTPKAPIALGRTVVLWDRELEERSELFLCILS